MPSLLFNEHLECLLQQLEMNTNFCTILLWLLDKIWDIQYHFTRSFWLNDWPSGLNGCHAVFIALTVVGSYPTYYNTLCDSKIITGCSLCSCHVCSLSPPRHRMSTLHARGVFKKVLCLKIAKEVCNESFLKLGTV